MRLIICKGPAPLLLLCIIISCSNNVDSNAEMKSLLSSVAASSFSVKNTFCPEARVIYFDSLIRNSNGYRDTSYINFFLGKTYLETGNDQGSISIFEGILNSLDPADVNKRSMVLKELGVAWMRMGERINCIYNHGQESCIFPVKGSGVHQDKASSKKAITIFEKLLKYDSSDLESRWLLNIAYMTTGEYPDKVPSAFLIKNLGADTSSLVKPFTDLAMGTGLNTKNMAGGSIVDDFNNDGYLDVINSGWGLDEEMHFSSNNQDGNFNNLSQISGLAQFTGGLNITQTDYNNDGLTDIFVLRGGWKEEYGNEPNSLLRNNGDGTFTDVTKESGLLSFFPTQTATWADFNNDGWLDVFIGNESSMKSQYNPCELYISNRDGTFTETAHNAGVDIVAWVKGVTSGDYDNDGLTDIFVSTLNGDKYLLRNSGELNGVVQFRDMSAVAGLRTNKTGTFPTWFWDYDNDGWLDIFMCGYKVYNSMTWQSAAEALGQYTDNGGKAMLFRNNRDGTFIDVSAESGINKVAFAMGSNFGDIDNDGYLDVYLGTGNPNFTSLIPNKMFKNIDGKKFADITTSARVGNLQKGHGVSFADLDNDGDLDIHIDMGGAYIGDAYENALYINPGQNNNHWINLSLEGVKSNRAAIGAKLKITFRENGVARSVHRDLNSGGSFGSNPLMQHIGIGKATNVDRIEIVWPGSHTLQVLNDIRADETIKIKEGHSSYTRIELKKLSFAGSKEGSIGCVPPF